MKGTPLRLPDWTSDLPDSAFITSTDLAKAMGLKCADEIRHRSDIPVPDMPASTMVTFQIGRGHRRARGTGWQPSRWRLGTLRAVIAGRIGATA